MQMRNSAKRRPYSASELEYVRKQLPYLTHRDIAAHLGRTRKAIEVLAGKLKKKEVA